MNRTIALLTDYGYQDTYVAQLKAVLMSMTSGVTLFDLTHGVPAGNRRSGAYLLMTAVPYLPDDSIVVAVVDPGVGTERRAVAVQGTRHLYVAPDNGLLSLALRMDPPQKVVELDNPRYFLPTVSATFHGRDIFAPVAAHLANGVPLEQLGSPLETQSLIQLADIEPEIMPEHIITHLLHVDRFGNLIFDLHEEVYRRWLPPNGKVVVEFCEEIIPLKRTFGDVNEGEPVAYFGSSGHLEIAVNADSAAECFGIDSDMLEDAKLHIV
ncbi:Adenosyl-chloride synthase [bacterium HR15]|nr:Adenosyl-chloride synthase [bacterium HR15]